MTLFCQKLKSLHCISMQNIFTQHTCRKPENAKKSMDKINQLHRQIGKCHSGLLLKSPKHSPLSLFSPLFIMIEFYSQLSFYSYTTTGTPYSIDFITLDPIHV